MRRPESSTPLGNLGQVCAPCTCVISHFPLRMSSQPGSGNEHRPLQNTVLCASQRAEKQDPSGSYQPNRPNNTRYSQTPNKSATQTVSSPFCPPNETHFKSQLHTRYYLLTSELLNVSRFPSRQKRHYMLLALTSVAPIFLPFQIY